MSNEIGPILRLNIDGDEVHAHRFNTALFTFAGNLACYNHIFITRETDEGRDVGNYIFASAEPFKDIVEFLETEEFPQHRNLTHVADCDRQAFENSHFLSFRGQEGFPVEWLDRGEE